MSNPMLDAALSYARRGWWVFPCQERGKIPLPDTTGSHMATRNLDIIAGYWARRPYNIGLATGARFGLVAFDFDVKDGKDGTAYYFANQELFPDTCTNMTNGGGFHLLYRLPDGVEVRNTASTRLAPGVDIRGAGGYILLPPSIHPSGWVYQWAVTPDDCPPPLISPLLLAQLTPPPPLPSGLPDPARRVPARYLVEWALRQIGRLGGRNNAGHALALQILDNRYFGLDGLRIMLEYQRQTPGGDYTEREARATWASAERSHTPRQPWPDRNGPRGAPTPDPAADLASLRRLAP